MNSAPKTIQSHQMYRIPSDINAPIIGDQRIPQNTMISTNNASMERIVYPEMNSYQLNIPQLKIAHNQTSITQYEVNNLSKTLKSSGQLSCCPYCKALGITRTEEKCSFSNVLCGLGFGPVSWILFQALRRKDMNCYDAEHFCINCGNKLVSYKAC